MTQRKYISPVMKGHGAVVQLDNMFSFMRNNFPNLIRAAEIIPDRLADNFFEEGIADFSLEKESKEYRQIGTLSMRLKKLVFLVQVNQDLLKKEVNRINNSKTTTEIFETECHVAQISEIKNAMFKEFVTGEICLYFKLDSGSSFVISRNGHVFVRR